jgi:hypothetical protein
MSLTCRLIPLMLLGGCGLCREEAPPETVIPDPLTAPCIFDAPEITTNGELLSAYGDALYVIAACDTRITEIRNLLNLKPKGD